MVDRFHRFVYSVLSTLNKCCCFEHQMAMRNIILLGIGLFFCACTNEATTIGAGFFSEGSLDLAYIDSSTVQLSTIQLDNVATNTFSRIVLGAHHDDDLGYVSASSFFQVGLNGTTSLKDMNVEYVYASLSLEYDGYFYYDTTELLTLNAHQVIEDIELDDNASIQYNDTFDYDPAIIGTLTFRPRPHRDDSIEIVLSESFGRALFDKAITGHKDLQTNDEFHNYIHGFVIVPDSLSNASMLGFNSSSVELRLYYKNLSNTPSTTEYLSFPLTDSYFSSYFRATRPSGFSALTSDHAVPSSETNDCSYAQGGLGLTLRVDLPYLRDLRQNSNFYMTHAHLEIYAVKNTYDKTMPLPETFTVYPVNGRNDLYTETTYTANLVEDDLERDTRYEIDITTFVRDQMDMQEFNSNGLMFIMPQKSLQTSVDRVYFSARTSQYKTRLKIYYATINE